MSVTDERSPNDARFRTTRWSLVQAAGEARQDESREALSELCQNYWFPVYAYFRRRTGNAVDAQDLTQEFFATLLEKNYLGDARQDRGRFRTFLLTAAQRFLSKERAKSNTLKRGGGKRLLSLDISTGEVRFAAEPVDNETPERTFERRWTLSLLEIAQQRLCDEYTTGGKRQVYDLLKPHLIGASSTERYAQVAALLGSTVGGVKTSVYRMRCRYRELLRTEIAETVADPTEIDDEIKQLFASLG
jgi:RNA polymerase sigma-70 factor (ECF subfamily)